MCIQCHMNLSDEELLEQLSEITYQDMDNLNETSISHFIIAASGFNGPVVRVKAKKVLFLVAEWLKKNKISNISNQEINNYLEYIHQNECEHHNREMLMEYLNFTP